MIYVLKKNEGNLIKSCLLIIHMFLLNELENINNNIFFEVFDSLTG